VSPFGFVSTRESKPFAVRKGTCFITSKIIRHKKAHKAQIAWDIAKLTYLRLLLTREMASQ
jgi:hypothetical protein